MQDNYTDDRTAETIDGQHVNPDGETDAEKGARAGAIGGAVTGAVAGSALGPGGALLGAAVGGVAAGLASGAAVAAVDKVDGDSVTDHEDIRDNGLPGIQTGGYANDGTPDTRGVMEKTADAITGDYVDDKTGKVVDSRTDPREPRYTDTSDSYNDPLGNDIPGVQTGGHAADGTPDTRGISEKTADALTGDNVDDKTGKRVS